MCKHSPKHTASPLSPINRTETSNRENTHFTWLASSQWLGSKSSQSNLVCREWHAFSREIIILVRSDEAMHKMITWRINCTKPRPAYWFIFSRAWMKQKSKKQKTKKTLINGSQLCLKINLRLICKETKQTLKN